MSTCLFRHGSVAFLHPSPKEIAMKAIIRRIVTEMSTAGQLTYLLPYEARLDARRATGRS